MENIALTESTYGLGRIHGMKASLEEERALYE